MEKTTLLELEREVKLIRSFIIGLAGLDKEGNYRHEFVKRVLESVSEKPKFNFKSETAFLARIRRG